MRQDTVVVEELRERLRRFAPERYPVQHATAQFHLGTLLATAGDLDGADAALREAVRLFAALPVERAKALNALGAVLRERGRPDDAAGAFAAAAEAFASPGLELERGAALFNLGLVRRDPEPLRQAVALLDPERVPAQAAAARRELAAVLLERGALDRARETLEEASALARHAGAAEAGATANALGLARLACGDAAGAIDALEDAAAAHPLSIRPAEHAMAKANLALAFEAAGRVSRARLAARQALAVSGAPAPVVEQASALLARLGDDAGDLAVALEEESPHAWPALLRDEVGRWLALSPEGRATEAATLVAAQALGGADLAEAWLIVALELPPDELETLLAAVVGAAGADSDFRATTERALVRFHTPQLLRLSGLLDRVARSLGQPPWTI